MEKIFWPLNYLNLTPLSAGGDQVELILNFGTVPIGSVNRLCGIRMLLEPVGNWLLIKTIGVPLYRNFQTDNYDGRVPANSTIRFSEWK